MGYRPLQMHYPSLAPSSQRCNVCALPHLIAVPSGPDAVHVSLQVSQTAFNRFGTRSRGDTSGWTDTPEMAAKRAAGLLTDSSGGPRLALAGPAAAGEGGAPKSAALKAAMAQYGQSRQKSLLELHAERQAGGKGGSKGEKREKGGKSEKGDKSEKREKGEKEKEKGSKGDKRDKEKKEKEKKGDKKSAGER